MRSGDRQGARASLIGFLGAILAAASIGLSAYASHGVEDAIAQSRLNTAALYGFGHGAVLLVLGQMRQPVPGKFGLYLLVLGTLLFSGSLVGGALWQGSTRLAPAGGLALMSGWLLLAVAALRR